MPNRTLNTDYVNQLSFGIQGLTNTLLVTAHGQVSDAVTGGAGPGIGALKLNCVVEYEIEYKVLANQVTTFVRVNNLPTSFTGGESVVDVGGSTVGAILTS